MTIKFISLSVLSMHPLIDKDILARILAIQKRHHLQKAAKRESKVTLKRSGNGNPLIHILGKYLKGNCLHLAMPLKEE